MGGKRSGFLSLPPEKQRELASKGGRTAHAKGTAHEFTREENRRGGLVGGRSISRDREHMSEIGRRGGKKRWERSNPRTSEPDPKDAA